MTWDNSVSRSKLRKIWVTKIERERKSLFLRERECYECPKLHRKRDAQ